MLAIRRVLAVIGLSAAMLLPAAPAQAQEICILVLSKTVACVVEPTP